ncbi:PREDICTED: ABC transporter G family member 20-like isoform X1 [Atta colombica]|uniref:ABC transporter G family member 20-like isoform X1 n=1 Tax=Atta colombica TaxID=520822 RepID=UPI00084CC993|nr:PREDICTED: ABC transporter G family member 20-like isoform X1 [Atta colombica]XP_018044365.1 PREDICTED: ABC transporter G family member 20-like isoform X1 [Atta colombica]XP_018044366.1 PREDICTED: ABC transporter G family member 20-like isoform X1 [Atta colombica]XP_018044367.1 PREDICTED: ABC transporter G family member 20-like isoform X1 [Atta colombica]
MVQQEAVIVRNAIKRYEKGQLVFDGLNMTVSKGSIYGLLGASGCGKTTLLSCIVGVRYLDSGEIWVLGGNPGSKGSGIPGPRVGYMPQEISLVGEFSVNGALYYFGRINGLDDEEIETRHKFFSDLLQLPPADRLVKNMSGGQQRRVSFAAALIHKPELLILDEPTVGLDPILRENIWAYLSQITEKENITVLITTHYIEETKDANKIGLMRCGKLLAESAPQKLLERFQCSYLEEAFLKLCEIQNNTLNNEVKRFKAEDTSSDVFSENEYERTKVISEYKEVSKHQISRLKIFKALLTKNGIQYFRYYGGLIFAIIFPIIQIFVFIMAIGDDPKDLKIGIVNDEAGTCGSNFGNVWNDEITCHFGNLSCRFLHNFDNSIATQEYYNKVSEARHVVQNGKLSGLLYFSQNFSEALQKRMEEGIFTKDSDLLASQIQVSLDMSDRQIGLFLQMKLFKRFLEIYKDIMKDCKYSSKLANPPIRFEEPIYGTTDLNYADYVAPTYMLTLIFFLATTVSTTLIITDRMQGVWDRSIVQGVKTEDILLSHIFIQSISIAIHTVMIVLLFFPIWGLECKGSIFTVIVLTFLVGFCGLMHGFIISVMCKDHIMANYCSAGSFYPLIIMSGCIWPVEGMPKGLRWFSYALPTTLPSISLRGVIYKGYSISESQVYIGFLLSIGWILCFFIVTILRVRLKSS